jgi:hypothetical protein
MWRKCHIVVFCLFAERWGLSCRDSLSDVSLDRGVLMSKSDSQDAADQGAEQTEELVNRRKAVVRFAEYTAPVMLAVLVSTSEGKAVPCVSCAPPPVISDIRLKRDIAPVGELAGGIGLYRYRYVWSDTTYVGVMAQEVAAVKPEAVCQGADGYLRVDYAGLGLRMQTWDQWLAAQ